MREREEISLALSSPRTNEAREVIDKLSGCCVQVVDSGLKKTDGGEKGEDAKNAKAIHGKR